MEVNKKSMDGNAPMNGDETMKEATPYEKVQLARKADRKRIMDYIDALFENFVELHGDRLYRDDPAMIGGIGTFEGQPVTIIGHKKGRNIDEYMKSNFGMASPEGYRKAMRLMKQAEKFNRPVITIIDTPGAYPGLEAEQNGQGVAIAESIGKMSRLKVPTIAIITGEGSSGGALAIATSDSVWMLENAVYAILSPEGFASIMWKDSKLAPEAAKSMKLTAQELKALGLIDGIIPEDETEFDAMRKMISSELSRLKKMSANSLVSARYEKYMKMNGNLK